MKNMTLKPGKKSINRNRLEMTVLANDDVKNALFLGEGTNKTRVQSEQKGLTMHYVTVFETGRQQTCVLNGTSANYTQLCFKKYSMYSPAQIAI